MDAADALVANGDENPIPDFDVPEEYSALAASNNGWLHMGDSIEKGRGWFAKTFIPKGTVLMVDKALAMVMDWQGAPDGDDDAMEEHDDESDEPQLNEQLLVKLLGEIRDNSALWTDTLSDLFPRDDDDLESLPAWVCHHDDVFLQVEQRLAELRKIPALGENGAKAIAKRLPLVIRYNALSVETCSELLSHPAPGGHSALAGTGIYHLPSYFNHDSQPNVSRWAIGNIMFFVANQDIQEGQEACISYLEHDVLCESAYRRNLLLKMDFQDAEGDSNSGPSYSEEDGPYLPVVDIDVQNELMGMDPFERLPAIDELMQQATGAKLPQEEEEQAHEASEDAMEAGGAPWFQCDIQNLRILQAITLDGLGQTEQALALWQDCVEFSKTKLPPNDESLVVMQVQAAQCAWHAGHHDLAKQYAADALATHNVLFGGGVSRFRRRYARELRLSIRPESDNGQSPIEELWPLL